MQKLSIAAIAIAVLAGCSGEPTKPAGQLHYKVSGPPGTPVLVEYYGTAVRPGDRRFARDLLTKEVRLPAEGYVRYWGAAEANGIAMLRVLNKDPSMKSCVEISIQVNDRTLNQSEACLKSYASEISATVPAEKT